MRDPTIVREPALAAGAEVDLLRIAGGTATRAVDTLAVEEPLEIRLNGWRWTVTMRTPGDDADLIVGLLASEGVIANAAEVDAILFSRHPEEPDLANVADARLGRPLGELQARLERHQIMTSSSCGLCGKSAVEALLARRPPVPPGPTIDAALITRLPDLLAAAQPVFRSTGGLHAAALFDAAGALLAVREDIGRHNATDKVLGWRLRAGEAGTRAVILLVSGRASFEIVQKAHAAAVPIVAAVSAASSLAVALAREAAMTLAGFVRGGNLNVYAGAERLVPARMLATNPSPPGGPLPGDPSPPRGPSPLADAGLEFIPTVVRTALDAVALKISLVDWQALTLEERAHLVTLATGLATDPPEGAAPDDFTRYLRERMAARTGRAPRALGAGTTRPS